MESPCRGVYKAPSAAVRVRYVGTVEATGCQSASAITKRCVAHLGGDAKTVWVFGSVESPLGVWRRAKFPKNLIDTREMFIDDNHKLAGSANDLTLYQRTSAYRSSRRTGCGSLTRLIAPGPRDKDIHHH